jgi:hypothetical protein
MSLMRAAWIGVLAVASALAVDDYSTYTSVGQIGMTITNFGVVGHGYNIEGQPSCLYRQYSALDFEQVEHFSYGGLWVGAVVDGEARVSTAVMDGTFGGEGWEWNNGGPWPPELEGLGLDSLRRASPELLRAYEIQRRSSLVGSPHYDPRAISHQDFLTSFSDTARVVPGTGELIENHAPLGLRVDLRSHAWNYSYADAFVILDLVITNISRSYDPSGQGWALDSLQVGYWIDEAVGNFNLHDYYAPGRGGWSWYDNLAGILVTDSTSTAVGDTINMAVGYDADGDNGYSESFVGVRFIGGEAPRVNDPRRIRPQANAWVWNRSYNQDFPNLLMPTNDFERFQRMLNTPSVADADFPYGTQFANSWMMLASAGSFGRLEPGESLNAVFVVACAKKEFVPEGALLSGADRLQRSAARLVANSNWARIAWRGEDKDGNGILDPGEDLNGNGILDRYLLPMPPPAPALHVELGERSATLYWRNDPESFVDPILGLPDFEGYRVWSSPRTPGAGAEQTLLLQVDLVNEIWPNTGLGDVTVRRALNVDADSVQVDGVWYHYAFALEHLPSGDPQGLWLAVSSYDRGQPENRLPSLESDIRENWVFLYPGALPAGAELAPRPKVGVYPNPYRIRARWDGSGAYERALWFTHLPPRCTISIFTLAGDLVDRLEHDAATWQGEGSALIEDRVRQVTADGQESVPFLFSGGEHAWDLVSRHDQAIATGLYLFTVENRETGEVEIGKFAVIK